MARGGAEMIPATQGILSYIPPTFYHNFLLLQFFTLAFILASYIIANLPDELLSSSFFHRVVIKLPTLYLYVSFIYQKEI